MTTYLWQVSYTAAGAAELINRGALDRVAEIEKLLGRCGGSLQCCYYSAGGEDLYVIGDVPDDACAVSLSLLTRAGGAARSTATTLLSAEAVDAQLASQLGKRRRAV